ncbi:oligosaccharyl transferase, archaeosortase A system-associated [Chloroflexota bacterium]
MNVYRLSPKLLAGILLVIFFGIALLFRVVFPYDQVFAGEWIKFTGVDAYYHMRLVDSLALNFPHAHNFDTYIIYPATGYLGRLPFFDWLLAGIIWVIGLGSPTQHTIDVIGVYFPAVLGALVVIPVYFIGKELFGRWAGVISAGLIAIMPGEFLGRSILGFTDHHVAETLFTATAIMFLIMAIKASRQRQLTFNHILRGDWAIITKPIVYALLAGITLGIYFFTWAGAMLFVFIISVYFIVQFIIDHLKSRSTDYLCLIGVILFLIMVILVVKFSPIILHLVPMIIALLIPLVLSGVSRLMAGKGIRPAYYPLALVGLALVGLAIFYVIDPSLLKTMLAQFSIFNPTGAATTTLEAQSIFSGGGNFFQTPAWGNFFTGLFFSFISMVILFFLVIKRGSAEKTLLLVWSVIILLACWQQRRFAYYFAVNVAVLTGYFSVLAYYVIRFILDVLRDKNTDYMSWRIFEFAGLKELMTKPAESARGVEKRRSKKEKQRKVYFRPNIVHISISLWVICFLLFIPFFPNLILLGRVVAAGKQVGVTFGEAWWNSSMIGSSVAVAKQAKFAPSDAWHSSLDWLRENTPEPYGDPDFYYQLYEAPPSGEYYKYPESAYGVTAWWDYGYWITRIAHRAPSANPSQSPGPITNVAALFLSQEESSTREIMQKLDSSYIIIDHMTATSKYWAMITWAERELSEFFEVYYLPYENELMPVEVFYPEYYRSLCARLYNFDGKAVTPQVSLVISFEDRVSSEGNPYKLITSLQEFTSYEEALEYLESQESANYRIIGASRFTSPVPLEELNNYKLVHSSDIGVNVQGVGSVPEVKIFEYIGN